MASRFRGALIVLAVTLVACTATPIQPSSASPGASGASTAVPTPTPEPTAAVACLGLAQPARAPLDGDPCPAGLAAVRAVVAALGTPTRIVLQPGRFRCTDVFSSAGCLGVVEDPGTSLHGWVAFEGTPKIAAVEVVRSMSFDNGGAPIGTPGPWVATVVRFVVPPATFASFFASFQPGTTTAPGTFAPKT